MAQPPELGDSEYNLLVKIAENFGVIVNSGDSKNNILYKIANTTYQSAINPPSPSYDPDALAYVQASGATDIQNINAFVVGIKSLGLWNSMVCWPLRSTQNAGTGSTAYSLGGLGTYNGTLVNVPTWNGDGLLFTASNQYVTLGNTGVTSGAFSNISVARMGVTTANGNLMHTTLFSPSNSSVGSGFYSYDGNNTGENSILFNGLTGGFRRTVGGTTITSNIGNYYRLSTVSTLSAPTTATGLVKINGLASVTSGAEGSGSLPYTSSETTSILFANSQCTVRDESGVFSMWVVGSQISEATSEQIRSLYKSTLGQGLGLP
jgi:hypothetical protein